MAGVPVPRSRRWSLAAARHVALALAALAPSSARATAIAAAADAMSPRRVFVLYSNSRLAPGILAVDRGLRAALAAPSEVPVQVFSEFLATPQFEGEAHEQTVLAYLRAKYRVLPPHAVVAVSDAAFD